MKTPTMNNLSNKVALVTGGGQGIGAAIVRLLSERGARVAITDIGTAPGERLAAELREQGRDVLFLQHDVTSEASWLDVISRVAKQFGRVDILVNNAGIADVQHVTSITLERFQQVIAVNVQGPFLGSKHIVDVMPHGGSIVNISSVSGLIATMPGFVAYSASKGAVRLMTKALAADLVERGIRVNSVHPGIIDTAIWQKIPQGGMGSLQLDAMQPGANAIDPNAIALGTPLGYPGLPSDIAAGIVFLASDESRYMTGTELVIDGGMTAR